MEQHTFYNIKSNEQEVTVHIYGVIGNSWLEESIQAQKLVKEIDSFSQKYTKAKFRINSPGGSLYDGLPIYNAIKRLPIETETYIDGMAYSMAAIIALASQKIIAAKNAMFMLHAPLGAAFGNAKSFRDTAENLDRYGESLMQSVMDRTGLPMEKVKENWFDYNDHLMTAQQAKELGFVDEVSDQEAHIDKTKNINDVRNFFNTENIQNLIPFQSLCNSITTAINAFQDKSAQAPGDPGQAANNQSIKTDMKQFKNVNAALGIESLEAVDGYVSLNDGQLLAIDAALANDGKAELQGQLETANKTISERDATIEDLNLQVETANNTISGRDATIVGLNTQIVGLKGEPAEPNKAAKTKTDGDNKTVKSRAIADKYDNPFDGLDEVAQEYLGKSIKK